MTCKPRRGLICLCLSLCLLFLPGCWDYRAINTRATLVGLGIDPVPDNPQKIRLTVQYPNLSSVGGSSGGGPDTASSGTIGDYHNETAEGYSVTEALEIIQSRIDRNIDTNQIRAVILSDKLPPKSMEDVVGQLLRRPQFNPLAWAVTTPGSAVGIMDTQSDAGAPMDIIDRKFGARFKQHGFSVRRQLWEYWRDETKDGVVPILPIATSVPLSDPNQTSGGDIAIQGFEVFKGGQVKAVVSAQDALYVNLLMTRVGDMTLTVPVSGGRLSLSSLHSKARLSTRIVNGQLHLTSRVLLRAQLARNAGDNLKPQEQVNLNTVEDQVEAFLLPKLQDELARFQSQGTDIFGFSSRYLQRYPEQQQQVNRNWQDMFRDAKTDVQLHVKVTAGGMLI